MTTDALAPAGVARVQGCSISRLPTLYDWAKAGVASTADASRVAAKRRVSILILCEVLRA